MSAEAYSWACRQTGMRPGAKLLLAMIANHAGKSGVAFPGRGTLSEECCYRPASVTDNMALLVEGGWLARFDRRRANGSKTSDWLVLAPNAEDRGEMTDADEHEYPAEIASVARRSSGSVSVPNPGGSGPVSPPGQVRFSGGPEPLEEPTTPHRNLKTEEEPQTTNDFLGAQLVTREEIPVVRSRGKIVRPPIVADAVKALRFFCERTGQRVAPFTARGVPSEALSRIITAMLDHPEVQTIYRRMIDRNLQEPWWDGRPTVGAIFGPKALDTTLVVARGEGSNGHRRGSDPEQTALLREMRLEAAAMRGEA